MSRSRPGKTRSALERTLSTLLLVIGSALPFALAWVLIASTSSEQAPLDRVPDYQETMQETLRVALAPGAAVSTQFEYRGRVRLILEGSGQMESGAARDAFYRFTGEDGAPLAVPRLLASGLLIDGQPALAALGLLQAPPRYDPEHVYTAIYDAGERWRRLIFAADDAGAQGTLRLTVIQMP